MNLRRWLELGTVLAMVAVAVLLFPRAPDESAPLPFTAGDVTGVTIVEVGGLGAEYRFEAKVDSYRAELDTGLAPRVGRAGPLSAMEFGNLVMLLVACRLDRLPDKASKNVLRPSEPFEGAGVELMLETQQGRVGWRSSPLTLAAWERVVLAWRGGLPGRLREALEEDARQAALCSTAR